MRIIAKGKLTFLYLVLSILPFNILAEEVSNTTSNSAATSLDSVLEQNSPTNSSNTLLHPQTQQDHSSAWVYSGRISLSGGNDDNADSAASDRRFLGFDIGAISINRETTYYANDASGTLGYRITPKTIVSMQLSASERTHIDTPYVDTQSLTAGVKLSHNTLRHSWSSKGSVTRTKIGEDTLRYFAALDLQNKNQLTANRTLESFFRAGMMEYRTEANPQDLYQVAAGFVLNTIYKTEHNPVENIYVIIGKDLPRHEIKTYETIYYGARYSMTLPIGERFRTIASLGYITNSYVVPLEGVDREDDKFDGLFSFSWAMGKQWSSGFNMSYTQNDSTISQYRYNRVVTSLSLSWNSEK